MALNQTSSTMPFSSFDLSDALHNPSAGRLNPVLLVSLLALWYTLRVYLSKDSANALIKVPVIGSTSVNFTRWQFFRNARLLINEGYRKFSDQMFKLSNNDILVIPIRYIEELRNYPDHKLSSIQANIDNFEGVFSVTNILLEGTLHTRMVQQKLNPKLGLFTPIIREALEVALDKEVPRIDDESVEVPAFHTVCHIISRISARVFVGAELCNDEAWLKTTLNYTENAFKCIIGIRCLPDWLKPAASWLMPSAWIVSYCLRTTKRKIGAEVVRRREDQAWPGFRETDKPLDFIQFMIDNANEFEGQPHKLAHRQLILSLASIHTTSMACTQTLFDLVAHPEYIPMIREEVEQVLREDGGWRKTSLTKMRKLDSFMRESQRLNPPSLLGFKRCAMKDVTLSDGTLLPKGAHTMCPIEPVLLSSSVYPNPEVFDPLRFYNLRQQPGEWNKHQFATTSPQNLHFGHGKYACPGRFFAGNVIKIIIGTLLLRYDLALPGDSRERPENVGLHEYNFPNPWAKVVLRKRKAVQPMAC